MSAPTTVQLRQTLAELELLSEVSAAQLGPSSRSAEEDIGGRRPPGGIDRRADATYDDDREVIPIAFKSLDHFKARIRRAETRAKLEDDYELEAELQLVLEDASAALKAWKEPRRWQPGDPEMEFGSTEWKRHVAESEESCGKLAAKWGCSRQYIKEIRDRYSVAS